MNNKNVDNVHKDLCCASLLSMGYPQNYIERAMDVHKKSKHATNWSLSILVEIIGRLQEKDEQLQMPENKEIQKESKQISTIQLQQSYSLNDNKPYHQYLEKYHDDLSNNSDDEIFGGIDKENNDKNIFIPHYMNIEEPLKLAVNDFVDYRYENGRYLLCKIISKSVESNNMMLLHPVGKPIYDTKYDRLVDIYQEYYKLAPAKSICLKQIKCRKHLFYHMGINDYIDINPFCNGHEGWKNGKIIKLDNNSSQVKVLYHNDEDNKNYSFWVHLQNHQEVTQFRTKCKNIDHHQIIQMQKRHSFTIDCDEYQKQMKGINNKNNVFIPYDDNDDDNDGDYIKDDEIASYLFGFNKKEQLKNNSLLPPFTLNQAHQSNQQSSPSNSNNIMNANNMLNGIAGVSSSNTINSFVGLDNQNNNNNMNMNNNNDINNSMNSNNNGNDDENEDKQMDEPPSLDEINDIRSIASVISPNGTSPISPNKDETMNKDADDVQTLKELDPNIVAEISFVVDNTWNDDIDNIIITCPKDTGNSSSKSSAKSSNNKDDGQQRSNNNNNSNKYSNNSGGVGGSGQSRDDGDDDEKKNNNQRKYDDNHEENDEEEEEEEKKEEKKEELHNDVVDLGPYQHSQNNVILSRKLSKVKKHEIQSGAEYELSFEPNSKFRAKGNIKVNKALTKVILPSRIDKEFTNLYRYIDKTTALQLSNGCVKLCNDGNIKIISYDFHDAETHEILYCVMQKQVAEIKRQWKLRDNLYTATEIAKEFDVDTKELPRSIRSTKQFTSQLYQAKAIENIINTKWDKDTISQIKWHRISIQNRQNNKKRLTLSFTKEEFIKSLMSYMRNNDKFKLLDILLFDDSNKYHIASVWIVQIFENTDIGISLRYNQKNDNIDVYGIHLDKIYLLEQHELVNRNHDCHCLDNFKSNINDLVIGNPDYHQNVAKAHKKTIDLLKSENNELTKENVKFRTNKINSDNKIDELKQQINNLKKQILHFQMATHQTCVDSIDSHKQYLQPQITSSPISNSPITPATPSVSNNQSTFLHNNSNQNGITIPPQMMQVQLLPQELVQYLAFNCQAMLDDNGNLVWVPRKNINSSM